MEMAIQRDSLLNLPAGASYNGHSGQARAEVKIRGDTIYVTASCDSLARAVEYYEALYHTARDELENYHEETEHAEADRTPEWRICATGLAVGWLAGIAMTIYMTTKTRKKDE